MSNTLLRGSSYQIYNDDTGQQYCMSFDSVKGCIITGLGPIFIRNLVGFVHSAEKIIVKYFDQSERELVTNDYFQAKEVIEFMKNVVTEYNLSVLRNVYLDCRVYLSPNRLRSDVVCVYLVEWSPKSSTDANRIIHHGVHVETTNNRCKYAFQTHTGKSAFIITHVK